jgi:hypothetical protein
MRAELDQDELTDAIAGALPDLDPAGERLAIAMYRQLATGRPAATAELAAAAYLAAGIVPREAGRVRPGPPGVSCPHAPDLNLLTLRSSSCPMPGGARPGSSGRDGHPEPSR